jgi:hypothetical protein
LKLPSLADFGQVEHFNFPFSMFYHYGNPGLEASPVYDYRIGWDHQFPEWDVTSRVSLFHQMTMRHMGTPFFLVGTAVVEGSAMLAGSVADGATLGFEHKARTGWTWGANYTYEQVHEHADLDFADSLPRHKVNANLGYGWESWDADLALHFASATKGTTITFSGPMLALVDETVKSYLTLAPRVSWHADDRITVELSADGLWPYRDSVFQRTDTAYCLTLKIAY